MVCEESDEEENEGKDVRELLLNRSDDEGEDEEEPGLFDWMNGNFFFFFF
jgi:hypothetical protein